jgi:beta-lactamase superfamily II metal-dependent hydrolase
MRSWVLILAAALTLQGQQPEVGKPLPVWTQGTLDIHQLSTGRGNAALFVFPDGTSMLVDAGAARDRQPMADTEIRPDDSHSAGEWIARYIQRALPGQKLDYALITHFHLDHMGQPTAASPMSKRGAYKLTGITDVAEQIAIGTLFDRGSTFLPPPDDDMMKNYRAFIVSREGRMKHEMIRAGRADQIVLTRDANAYPRFEVRNIAANGDVWTGEGNATHFIFPPADSIAKEDTPNENMCSIALRIRYGKFDFFTGGDMPGVPDAGEPEWTSVEREVARAVGPTDVHVVNHHGSVDPASAMFLSTLRSQVIIIPAWSPTHPSQDALKRILAARLYPGTRDVFITTLRPPTRVTFGPRVDQLKAEHGHIVVRVAPGGDLFRVYVLDDMHPDANVVSVWGPYSSN